MIDLLFKDVEDPYARENFFRLRKFLDSQLLFEGDFKLFDITIPKKNSSFEVLHGLTYIPTEIIPLAASGNLNYFFKYQYFDKSKIIISANGPVRVRFLAGKLKEQLNSAGNVAPFDFVAPGDVVGPSSPGFVYGAVNAQTSGFWLTSEGISSNVVGVPVLFSDAVIKQVAVGSETETDYIIGIYQHEGAGVNLTQLGTFSVVSGGAKRLDLNFAVNPSTNVQLACRLESGNTKNLKISLVVKGTAI